MTLDPEKLIAERMDALGLSEDQRAQVLRYKRLPDIVRDHLSLEGLRERRALPPDMEAQIALLSPEAQAHAHSGHDCALIIIVFHELDLRAGLGQATALRAVFYSELFASEFDRYRGLMREDLEKEGVLVESVPDALTLHAFGAGDVHDAALDAQRRIKFAASPTASEGELFSTDLKMTLMAIGMLERMTGPLLASLRAVCRADVVKAIIDQAIVERDAACLLLDGPKERVIEMLQSTVADFERKLGGGSA